MESFNNHTTHIIFPTNQEYLNIQSIKYQLNRYKSFHILDNLN
jgi:hypothetical protein